jgi:ribosomal protein S18 acetylase RimI-like enzyme
MQLRRLTAADLGAVHDIEVEVYLPSLVVADAAFERLIDLFPAGALGAFDDEGLCGFIVGLPLRSGSTLDLHAAPDRIPDDADVFYVHDIAVARRCRGRGVGSRLAAALLVAARAAGFTRAELVSVQGSAPFWAAFGFRAVRELEYAPGAPSVAMAASI